MTSPHRFSSLPLALALSLVLLLASAVHALGNLGILFEANSAMAMTLGIRVVGTPLGVASAGFVAALLALHAAFGLAVWSLARLSEFTMSSLQLSRSRWVVLWFTVSTLWVLVASATLYPWSRAGIAASFWSQPVFAGTTVYVILSVVVAAAIAALMLKGALRSDIDKRVWRRAALYGTLFLAIYLCWPLLGGRDVDTLPMPSRPNVILIGVDSLRPDVVGGATRIGVTPNIDQFLREAAFFSDAITPLARTFPSWISILSGEYPRHTGARENLIPRSKLRLGDTLPETLRNAGYTTIYATDETRFSNIDAAYGFDEVIGPIMGAPDFALAELNDMPLSNVVANTTVARYLFPATYSNRAAANTYRPETFTNFLSDRLDALQSIDEHRPIFLSLHLTLPHSPFHHADLVEETFDPGSDKLYQYLESVIAVDEQVGAVLADLQRRGALRNAIVVLLSDHGEALGRPHLDSIIEGAQGRGVLGHSKVNLWGHGTSVLSFSQYHVVLAFRGYGPSQLDGAGKEIETAATLVDIEPTLIDILNLGATKSDGLSLLPALELSAPSQDFLERGRFTESGISAPLDAVGEVDAGAVKRSAALFHMNPTNARIELRDEALASVVASKERAVLRGPWLLAALPPDAVEKNSRYVLVDRTGVEPPRTLNQTSVEPDEVRAMIEALEKHFGPELTRHD